MITVPARGRIVILGSNDPWSNPAKELPYTSVSFDYSFGMDATEITQGQWKGVFGTFDWGRSNPGIGDSLPVYHVTFFDAILFCNARSRKSGMDTVYAYGGISRSADGHVRVMEQLRIRWNVKGFRLPTEAEWQFAATAGTGRDRAWSNSSPDGDAWYSANSDGRLHPVRRKNPNAYGGYDFFGNVMEWTSDWMGDLPGNAITNFVGPAAASRIEEKVVKGGGYVSPITQMRANSRTQVYPTAISSALEYLGFRCVLGEVGQPGFGTDSTTGIGAVKGIQGSANDLLHKLHSLHARVALVRETSKGGRVLEKVDITPGRLLSLLDTLDTDVYTPAISPNGEWIAYGSTFEGNTRAGVVRILSWARNQAPVEVPNACIPRWYVPPLGSDTFLVVADHAGDNTEPDFGQAKTMAYRFGNGRIQGSGILIANGTFHDGVSPNGKYLASGYRQLKVTPMVNADVTLEGIVPASASARTLFVSPQNGKPDEDTAQACNLSWRPLRDSSQLMFLDFGYSKKHEWVGRPYGIHEIAFLYDAEGRYLRHFAPPEEYVSFEALEFSNHSRYAITLLKDMQDQTHTVGLLDLEQSRTFPILHGEGLSQPCLWIDPVSSPLTTDWLDAADSLGRFDEPLVFFAQGGYSAKTRLFLTQRNKVEIAIVGSSHIELGIAPGRIQAGYSVNLGISALRHEVAEHLVRDFILPHAPKLKAVVFEVCLGMLADRYEETYFHEGIQSSKGYVFHASHQFFKTGLPEYFDPLLSGLSPAQWFAMDDRGGETWPSNGWGQEPIRIPEGVAYGADHPVVQQNLQRIERFVRELDSLHAPLLLVTTPSPTYFKQNGLPAINVLGPAQTAADSLNNQIRGFCNKPGACLFYDGHQSGNHGFVSSDFADFDHLSAEGSQKFSVQVDSAIRVLLKTP